MCGSMLDAVHCVSGVSLRLDRTNVRYERVDVATAYPRVSMMMSSIGVMMATILGFPYSDAVDNPLRRDLVNKTQQELHNPFHEAHRG